VTAEIYTPEERKIFHYYTGEERGVVKADPMVLYKKLMEVQGDLSAELSIAFSPSKGAAGAHQAVIAKIHSVFSVKPYDQGGLLETECLTLLQQFWDYCAESKKNSKTSATPPEATPECSPSPTDAGPTTPSTSGCGSTAPASPTA
jgi:hypothetical protein